MRVFLPGRGPRIERLRAVAIAAGLEITESIAEAEVWLCCQPEPLEGPVTRHHTLAELQKEVQGLTGTITICLVSFQPNTLWTMDFCHAADRVIGGNTGHDWEMTRAHVQTSVLERTSPLILGVDSKTAEATLRAVWQPLTDLPLPEEFPTVLQAEFAAVETRVKPKTEVESRDPSVPWSNRA